MDHLHDPQNQGRVGGSIILGYNHQKLRESERDMLTKNSNVLDELLTEFQSMEIDLARMNAQDMNGIKNICKNKDYIIWLNDHLAMKPIYINDFGKRYYGFKKNDLTSEDFEFYENLINPIHFKGIHQTITFFLENPNGRLSMPYNVKNHKGEWRWTYSTSFPINHTAGGKVSKLISVVFDIEELLRDDPRSIGSSKFESENLKRYKSLTSRELEILKLIAKEMTSGEIAKVLHIESSTVDTHRKHLIKKLGVKSSIGLVRYAIYFS